MTKLIDTRESVRVVTSNNFWKIPGLEDLNIKERKLLLLAIAQCKLKDNEFFTYEISVKEFAEFMGIDASNLFKESYGICKKLFNKEFEYVDEKTGYDLIHLFSRCTYIKKDHKIVFKLNSELSTMFLNLKKDFSQPLLNDFSKMKSLYAMQLWQLFQEEMKSKKPYGTKVLEFELTLDELRKATGTQEKLKQLSQFKEKVLDKAIQEIYDNCGVKITYTNIKKSRTVIGFHFKAVTKYYIEPEQMTLEMFEKLQKIENSQ